VAAGHRSAGERVEGFAVALEQDRLVAVDQAEPLLTVVGVGAVEEAPVDRIGARAADPHVGVGQQHLAANAEQGVTQVGVGEHARGGEAVDHGGAQAAQRFGLEVKGHGGALHGSGCGHDGQAADGGGETTAGRPGPGRTRCR